MPVTTSPLLIATQVKDHMRAEHPEPTDADWTVCWSTEDQAAAVVFQPRPTMGARPGVRCRYLWQWQQTLNDAGFTVEARHDGPDGDDPIAPWWLRITAAPAA
ncbi:hypothetical protein [Streptomyces sp. DSM 41534]